MVHCKASVAGALRRFSVVDGPTDGTDAPPLTLQALRRAVSALDPAAPAPASLGFVDEEGDVCALLNNGDLREALVLSPNLLRLRVSTPTAADRGAAGARGAKRAGAGVATGKNGGAGAPGKPGGPVPLLKRVEAKAVGDAYGAALASFLEAAQGADGVGVFQKKTGIEVCRMVRIFMSKQAAGRGDAAMVSAIPKESVDELCLRANTYLEDSSATQICRERLVAVIQEALSDTGVRAGLVEVVRAARSNQTAAGNAADQTPLQFIIQSATTPKSRVAINKARRAMRESNGARKLLHGVRPAIRKAGMSFVREQCVKGKGPGVPLKSPTAPEEFGADIRKIVAEAGADAAVFDAAEEFAVAMANDPGARLAGVRLLRKFRQQRLANKAGKAGAAAAAMNHDVASSAGLSAPAADADVDMAAAAIATASI